MKPSLCVLPILLNIVFATSLVAQQGQSPLPALPPDIPKDATIWMLLMDKTPAGQDAVWTTPDGAVHEFFQFNDRGRGPKTYSTYRLDSRGIVIFEETSGVDYMKNSVSENFSVKDSTASWKSQVEDGHEANPAGRFFVGLDAGPASTFLLAQGLMKNGGKLSLLPGGEASLRELKTVPVEANGKKVNATLYQVEGLDFSPTYLWCDEQRNALAVVQGWSGLIRVGFESTFATLYKTQDEIQSARSADLAKHLIHHPAGDLVIKNVTILTAAGPRITNGAILLKDGKIESVGASVTAPSDAVVIDGGGKFVTPGFIDVHSHLGVYAAPGVEASSDGNEATRPVTAYVWAEHSVWPQDPQFPRNLAGGLDQPGDLTLVVELDVADHEPSSTESLANLVGRARVRRAFDHATDAAPRQRSIVPERDRGTVRRLTTSDDRSLVAVQLHAGLGSRAVLKRPGVVIASPLVGVRSFPWRSPLRRSPGSIL